MKRGIVSLTNLELKALYGLIVIQNPNSNPKDISVRENLLTKLAPIRDKIGLVSEAKLAQEHDILINEDEAELILDSMSAPSEDDDLNLASARIKIQQFLSKSRFD